MYVLPPDGPEYVLKQEGVREMEAEMDLHWPELDRGELVTMEALLELLARFEKGELRRLELHWCEGSLVFWQLSQGRPQAQGAGGWLWDSNTNQLNGQHKRYMAQQKVGGFPPIGAGTAWRSGLS